MKKIISIYNKVNMIRLLNIPLFLKTSKIKNSLNILNLLSLKERDIYN